MIWLATALLMPVFAIDSRPEVAHEPLFSNWVMPVDPPLAKPLSSTRNAPGNRA